MRIILYFIGLIWGAILHSVIMSGGAVDGAFAAFIITVIGGYALWLDAEE